MKEIWGCFYIIIKLYIPGFIPLNIGPFALTLRPDCSGIKKNRAAWLNTEILLLSINTHHRICSAAESSIAAAFFDRLVQKYYWYLMTYMYSVLCHNKVYVRLMYEDY